MSKIQRILMMESAVCPSWLYFSLNNFLRKGIHSPEKLFSEFVRDGDTVIDLGCGPGFFIPGFASMVGKTGRVFAVDIQRKAIEGISKKIRNTDLESIVKPVLTDGTSVPVNGDGDFALMFWMLHEVPDKKNMLEQLKSAMKPGSLCLIVEPKIHVSERTFIEEIAVAESCGMEHIDNPVIPLSRSALFRIRERFKQ